MLAASPTLDYDLTLCFATQQQLVACSNDNSIRSTEQIDGHAPRFRLMADLDGLR